MSAGNHPASIDNVEAAPIKISYSELSTWLECRQRWDYQYVRRLRPRVEAYALSVGDAGHVAVQAHFQGEDAYTAVDKWLDKKFKRGELIALTEEDLDQYRLVAETAKAIVHRAIQRGFWNGLEPTMVEERFEVPLPFKYNGRVVLLVGVWDRIMADMDGSQWLCELKFPGSRYKDEDGIALDLQLGLYQWAARVCGLDVIGIRHEQIWGEEPKVPKITKDGKSVYRTNIRTDWETYLHVIRAVGGDPAEYEEMRSKIDLYEWDKEIFIYRTDQEIGRFMLEASAGIKDYLINRETVYRRFARHCESCWYREPCIEFVKSGSDEGILDELFEGEK